VLDAIEPSLEDDDGSIALTRAADAVGVLAAVDRL